ncbi:MAG: NAD(P)/FAD-dependent oxidoreductase [Methanobacteriota archaeon]
MLQYDVLVVGGGPAGSSAASAAVKAGAKVLLIEKKKIIGEPVRCAEFIPKLLLHNSQVDHRCIVQEIRGMKIYFPNGEYVQTNAPGFMLDRSRFDKELAGYAKENGADLLTGTMCVSKRGKRVLLNNNGRQEIVGAQVIIGADGPKSTVGKWIHSINHDFILGYQYQVPLKESHDCTEIFFDADFVGGYAWLFPKGNVANVGIGIRYHHQLGVSKVAEELLKKILKRVEDEGKIENRILSATRGVIPVGGPLPTVKENIILVGDAAGQTHPITGGGIPQAMICGEIAGRVAATAVQEGRNDRLLDYEKEWKSIFGAELERARMKRRLLESQWNKLDTIMKQCWVIFREYYE